MVNDQVKFAEKIITKRLVLSRPDKNDLFVLSKLWQSEQVRQYLGGVLSDAAAIHRIEQILNNWEISGRGLWSIQTLEQVSIGVCGLEKLDNTFELIFKLFPEYQGKGYAYESALATIKYGFSMLDLDHIIAITQEANLPSQKLLHKLGMCHRYSFKKWNESQRFYELKKENFSL